VNEITNKSSELSSEDISRLFEMFWKIYQLLI